MNSIYMLGEHFEAITDIILDRLTLFTSEVRTLTVYRLVCTAYIPVNLD